MHETSLKGIFFREEIVTKFYPSLEGRQLRLVLKPNHSLDSWPKPKSKSKKDIDECNKKRERIIEEARMKAGGVYANNLSYIRAVGNIKKFISRMRSQVRVFPNLATESPLRDFVNFDEKEKTLSQVNVIVNFRYQRMFDYKHPEVVGIYCYMWINEETEDDIPTEEVKAV